MEVKITYSDYLTADNKKKISKVSVTLDANRSLEFDIIEPILETDQTTCKIRMTDESTASEVESTIDKEDFTELIALIREISTQF